MASPFKNLISPPSSVPDSSTSYRGRFAPSPTGALHFGSLLAALASWLRARSQGGIWLVRIEDIDPPREVAGASEGILSTLAAFGLVSDEPVLYQRDRSDAYARALVQLKHSGRAFTCGCSRRMLAPSGAHHGRCPAPADPDSAAWRLQVGDAQIDFVDAIQGAQHQHVGDEVGDFVLRRADGLWAYQLAVVVDDAAQGITEIVRGADLLSSTPRQILLQRSLGLPTPAYAHIPALHGEDGSKLSKQSHARPIHSDDPIPALRQALAVLGIDRARLPTHANPNALLRAATLAFDLQRIPALPFLRSATWHGMANG